VGFVTGSASFPTISPATVAARACCPRCGRGRLYEGFLTVADRCTVCGLDLRRCDTGDGPAVFLIFILGILATPVALWIAMTVDWPLWLHAVLWFFVLLALTIGMLRPSKAYLVALQYRHRRSELEIPSTPNPRD
jgi:uncharacterized protein (DUF983 family)